MSGRSGHRWATTRRFAGLTSNITTDEENLYVLGLTTALIRDDEAAKLIEDGRHLQQAANGVIVDRFDVRLLLDNIPVPPSKVKRSQAERSEEQELDAERYRDLDPAREHELEFGPLAVAGGRHDSGIDGLANGGYDTKPSDSGTTTSSTSSSGSASDSEDGVSSGSDSDSNPDAGMRVPVADADRSYEGELPPPDRGRYAAVHFNYDAAVAGADTADPIEGTDSANVKRKVVAAGGGEAEADVDAGGDEEGSATAILVDDEPYMAMFAVPSHLKANLPENQRVHRLLVRTARFVSDNGDQVEVLLRVRQAKNPTFAFLLPGHSTFPYYRWVVETRPRELTPLNTAPSAAGNGTASEVCGAAAADVPAAANVVGTKVNAAPDVSDIEGEGLVVSEQREEALVDTCGKEQSAALGLPFGPQPAQDEEVTSAGAQIPVHHHAGSPSPPPPPAVVDSYTHIHYPAAIPSVQMPMPPYSYMAAAPLAHPGAYLGYAGSVAPHPPTFGSAYSAGAADAGSAADAQPPAVTKSIIEKLVMYVAKNGITFESVVRKRERSNPAFAFLLPWGAYHSYYRRRLEQVIGVAAVAAALDGAATTVAGGQGAAEEQTGTGGYGSAAATIVANPPAAKLVQVTAVLTDGVKDRGSKGVTRVPESARQAAVDTADPVATAFGARQDAAAEERSPVDVGGPATAAAPTDPLSDDVATAAQTSMSASVPSSSKLATAVPAVVPPKVVIRANPKLATAAIRPPKPPPPSQPAAREAVPVEDTAVTGEAVLTAADGPSGRGARRDAGGERTVSHAEELEEGEVMIEEGGESKEGGEEEAAAVLEEAPENASEAAGRLTMISNENGGESCPRNRPPTDTVQATALEGRRAGSEDVASKSPAANVHIKAGTAIAGNSEVIMVFESLESSSSDSDSESESGLESQNSEDNNDSSGATYAGGDDGVRARKPRQRWLMQSSRAPPRLLQPSVANDGGRTAANTATADPDAAARLEARRQAARLLVAKARAQQEVAAAAQRSRAIHHHRHFFLRAADEEEAAALPSGDGEGVPIPPAAVAAALAARSAAAAVKDATASVADPLGGGVSAAEVLALERLLERQKQQQAQQLQGRHQQLGAGSREPQTLAVGAVPTVSALQPTTKPAVKPRKETPLGEDAAMPSQASSAVAPQLASSLPAVRELVVAAAAAAAQHRAAFEAMLRDPAQVIRAAYQEAAPISAPSGDNLLDGGRHSRSRRRQGPDGRENSETTQERAHARDRKCTRRGYKFRSRSRSPKTRQRGSRERDRKRGRSRSASLSRWRGGGGHGCSHEHKQRRRGEDSRSRSPRHRKRREKDPNSPGRNRDKNRQQSRSRKGGEKTRGRQRHKGKGDSGDESDGDSRNRSRSDERQGQGNRRPTDVQMGKGRAVLAAAGGRPEASACTIAGRTETCVAPGMSVLLGGENTAPVPGSLAVGTGAAGASAGDLRARLRQLLSDGAGLS